MDSLERFKKIMDILENNNIGNSSRSHVIFKKLKDEELDDETKVNEVIKLIKELEAREENNPNKYPENIMQYLRQRSGLDKYDFSEDDRLSEINESKAFEEVCSWNGLLGGWDRTIKGWIKDIYKIDLDDIK